MSVEYWKPIRCLYLRVVAVSVSGKSAIVETVWYSTVWMIDGCLEACFSIIVLTIRLVASVAGSSAVAASVAWGLSWRYSQDNNQGSDEGNWCCDKFVHCDFLYVDFIGKKIIWRIFCILEASQLSLLFNIWMIWYFHFKLVDVTDTNIERPRSFYSPKERKIWGSLVKCSRFFSWPLLGSKLEEAA